MINEGRERGEMKDEESEVRGNGLLPLFAWLIEGRGVGGWN